VHLPVSVIYISSIYRLSLVPSCGRNVGCSSSLSLQDTRLKCDLYTKSLDTIKRPKETHSLEMSYSSPGDCERLLHGHVVRRSEAIGGIWSRWSIAIYMSYFRKRRASHPRGKACGGSLRRHGIANRIVFTFPLLRVRRETRPASTFVSPACLARDAL
jgi:hypothetical protein